MTDIQTKLAGLKSKGWTYAAIADELEVTSDAVKKWKAGTRKNPHNAKAVLILLEQLSKKKPPKKRRYAPGSRRRQVKDGT